jgi:HPt (histidine-containing phosphotransfer) domain-containing protein
MPGGEFSTTARSRPIDLVHLARQTMGDRGLEQEVLCLFVQQCLQVRDRLAGAAPKDRRNLAHGLKGAARGVGAFAIADCAGLIEADPADRAAIRKLARLIVEARDFIAAIGR